MKIIAFDLDDVLCFRELKYEEEGINKYKYCLPIYKNIELINQCYNSGYYIKIYTARGMTQFSGSYEEIIKNLYDLTYLQLKSWGVNFHELIFGKTHYDLLIDDKALNISDIIDMQDIKKFLNEV